MDQFADRLARLADLSPEELDALETELVAAFDQADSAGDVDLMQQLADALDTVRAAKTARRPRLKHLLVPRRHRPRRSLRPSRRRMR